MTRVARPTPRDAPLKISEGSSEGVHTERTLPGGLKTTLSTLYCTKCRKETMIAHMERDKDAYWYCGRCYKNRLHAVKGEHPMTEEQTP